MECVQCTVRPPHHHGDPLPIMNRSGHVTTAPCQCSMCHQTRNDMKCHYPHGAPPGAGYPSSYKNGPTFGGPMTVACRDPNCTNCSKYSAHTNFQNFLHPALIHQCTHNGPPPTSVPTYKSSPYPPAPPPPPPPAHVSPYDPYTKNTGSKPYVCNWVSDGKHCGNTFVSSEELFQHLRTHTNSQQQANNSRDCDTKPHDTNPLVIGAPPLLAQPPSVGPPPPSAPTCNIHGCPCGAAGRKSSPKQHSGHSGHGPYGSELSRRYSPYSRMMSSGGSSVGSHSYPPYHY